MFGLDPISGRSDRLVVAAVEGMPEPLVSGEVDGNRYTLSHGGRLIEVEVGSSGATLGARRRRALAVLARRVSSVYGSPQDIEWAFDENDRLWLLQSRPVTAAEKIGPTSGPVLGPGPVAETFPAPLSILEQELWVEPLREGLEAALSLLRTVPKKAIAASPKVVSIDGRVAADLELLGVWKPKRSWLARLDPRGPARRLLASWDVGRLRSALPGLSERTVKVIDAELAAVPSPAHQEDRLLLDVLQRTRVALRAVHGHEVLAGMLLRGKAEAESAASQAMRIMAAARKKGWDDEEVIAREPVVLALIPPAIGRRRKLPAVSPAAPPPPSGDEDPLARARENLRLRARWLHELGVVVVEELAERLCRAGSLQSTDDIAHLSLTEIERLFASPPTKIPLETIERRRGEIDSGPLPVAFRLTASGAIVAEAPERDGSGGSGAGGGRGKGRVVHDPAEAGPGDVLVVRTLDPDLAGVLPTLAGLVSETGSVLSHLAILAREFDVPAVVAYKDALTTWSVGTTIALDGRTGDIVEIPEVGRDR